MHTNTITRVVGGFGAAALVALGMATAVPRMSAAQEPPQHAGRMGGRGFGGPGGPGMRGGGPGGALGLDLRDLTDEQRQQVRAIYQRHADEMKPVLERVATTRKALADAVLAGTGDVRGLAVEVGSAEGELAFQNAQIETEVLALLTPEQKQKIAERRQQMEARRTEMQQRRQSRGGASGNQK